MSIQPDNSMTGMPDNIEARPFSGGAALREAREQLGLSVADVANRLKFAPRQIEALEADDFARLPELAFVRGFVRSYAKLLLIDSAPLLAALPQAPAQPVSLIEATAIRVPFPAAYAARKLNIIWLGAGLLVALVLGLFTWMSDDPPEEAQIAVEALELPMVSEQPASAVEAVPAAVSAIPDTVPSKVKAGGTPIHDGLIHLVFEDDSWVEVADKNGKNLLAQLNPRGSEQRLNGVPPFSLVIGNASRVRLYYQGKRIDLTPYNTAEIAHLTLE